MTISSGDEGDNVRVLQHALNAHGFTLDEDGIFGTNTDAAVRAFQQQQGLDVDGIAGTNTLQALGLDPDTLQPLQPPPVGDTTNSNPPVVDTTDSNPPNVTPVLVWQTHPFPPSEAARFDTALANLEALVAASNDARTWRYRCWFEKLKTSTVDERVIEWGLICPSTSGAIGAAFVVGPCDISRGMRPSQEAIEQAIHSVADVDAVGESVGIFTYLKASIVVDGEMTALPLENLRAVHDDVQLGLEKLEKWANSETGGSSAMPPAYQAIKEWLRQRQNDANSTYSCM